MDPQTFGEISVPINAPYIIDTTVFHIIRIGFCLPHETSARSQTWDDSSGTHICSLVRQGGDIQIPKTFSINRP